MKNMDVSVPSLMNNFYEPNPQSFSIYEQDKTDIIQSSLCGRNTFSNTIMDTSSAEEFTALDDKIENSNLKNIFTRELMNNLNASSSSAPSDSLMQLESKLPGSNNMESNTNLTLNEINMDNDMAFLDSILSYDLDDNSKLSFSSLDLLTGDFKSTNSSSCHTPLPLMCVEPNPVSSSSEEQCAGSSTKDTLSGEFLTTPSGNEELKNLVGLDYFQRLLPPKNNFPPRETQPPVIGIVAPVKKSDEDPHDELKPDLLELKSNVQSSNCPVDDFKVINPNNSATVAYSFMETAPQTVPSCCSLKRGFEDVKSEPESPLCKKQRIEVGPLEDMKYKEQRKEDVIRPQRKRNDSGASSHKSDSADDEIIREMDDSDDDDDFSDIDADIFNLTPSMCESLINTGKKQKQYFWQYNVQSKGPKGTRLKLAVDAPKDPHVLNYFEDPVFDECNTVVAGIRHGGKARKGDGNEISPNPKKLVLIGHQLLKLNKRINACQLGSDVSASKRNESRREKNKLASRACRLKKKAQHEANKIKLHGLEEEHTQLNQVVQQIWPMLRDRAKVLIGNGGQADSSSDFSTPSLSSALNSLISNTYDKEIANRTTEYVNNVILKVEAGDPKGGLNIPSKKS